LCQKLPYQRSSRSGYYSGVQLPFMHQLPVLSGNMPSAGNIP
jgi:hypothetical protein